MLDTAAGSLEQMEVFPVRAERCGTCSPGRIRNLLDEGAYHDSHFLSAARYGFQNRFAKMKLVAIQDRNIIVVRPIGLQPNIDGHTLHANKTEHDHVRRL